MWGSFGKKDDDDDDDDDDAICNQAGWGVRAKQKRRLPSRIIAHKLSYTHSPLSFGNINHDDDDQGGDDDNNNDERKKQNTMAIKDNSSNCSLYVYGHNFLEIILNVSLFV